MNSRWNSFSFLLARFTPSRLPFTLIFPVSVSVNRALHHLKGFVKGMILHFRLFTRIPRLQTAEQFHAQVSSGFHIRQNQIVIVHVMPKTVNPGLTFDPVIHGAWQRHHFLL
jgi:hypothetical protein